MKLKVSRTLAVKVKYLWKKDNSFYYKRKLPKSKSYKYVHLGTDPLVAIQKSQELAAQDDALWFVTPAPASKLNNGPTAAPIDPGNTNTAIPTGNGVCAVYLALRKGDEKFEKVTKLAFKLLTTHCGDLLVTQYRRTHANDLVSKMLKAGSSTATVRRRLKSICAGFNIVIREHELNIPNPFENVRIPGEHEDEEEREPLTEGEMLILRRECPERDDDLRWMLMMLADTGARLAEVVGLDVSDVVLRGPVPYIDIRPHPWRPLKTKASIRRVPLVGLALAAAERAVQAANSGRLFTRYTDDTNCSTNTASATLNKRMRSLGIDKTCHCLRHTMRDRLRAIECPSELMNMIGGWTTGDVGSKYGRGYPLSVKRDWLQRTMQAPPLEPTHSIRAASESGTLPTEQRNAVI
jgi:integrase